MLGAAVSSVYHQSVGRKTSLLDQAVGHLSHDEAASNPVIITWQISFDYARGGFAVAQELFQLAGDFKYKYEEAHAMNRADGSAAREGARP